jgi:hypothetical protein
MPLSALPPAWHTIARVRRLPKDLSEGDADLEARDIWAAATLAVLLAALNGCGKTEHAGSALARRHAAKKPPTRLSWRLPTW